MIRKRVVENVGAVEREAAKLVALNYKPMLNRRELAEWLGVSDKTVYQWTTKKKIPYYKPYGQTLYFKRTEVEKWLTQNRVATRKEVEELAESLCVKGGAL